MLFRFLPFGTPVVAEGQAYERRPPNKLLQATARNSPRLSSEALGSGCGW